MLEMFLGHSTQEKKSYQGVRCMMYIGMDRSIVVLTSSRKLLEIIFEEEIDK